MLLFLLAAALAFPASDTPIELRGGEKHEYELPLKKGEFMQLVVDQRGIDVVVVVYAPDGKEIANVDSPNGANGPEPVAIASVANGVYRIEVRSFDNQSPPGKYAMRIEERLTPRQYRTRVAEERARDEAVIAWMRARAFPLRSVEPGAGFDDLAPFERALAGVRVVGIGESTHGSHEIFTLKNRLIEFLVARMGFTIVALEGSVSLTAQLNDYVEGRLDRQAALALLEPSGWISNTQEFEALLDWLRKYNETAPQARRVRLVGLDPQVNAAGIAFLRTYAGPQFHELLDALAVQDLNAIQFARTDITQEQLRGMYRLLSYLMTHEGDLVRQTSAADHRRAVETARLLVQFAEFNASLKPGEGGTRDQYMADHLFRALQASPDARAVVWAHNAHIAARQTGSYPPMGGFFRGAFGSQYYALAIAFDRGAFQAQLPGPPPVQVREFSVPAAAEGTVDWFLARATDGHAIVDLRLDPPSDPRIAAWLQPMHRMHWVGGIYSDQSTPWQPFVLARDFDGIAFIESTTRARPR